MRNERNVSARIVHLRMDTSYRCLRAAEGAEPMRMTEKRDLAFFGWLFGAILLVVFWWSGELDPVFKWIDKIG